MNLRPRLLLSSDSEERRDAPFRTDMPAPVLNQEDFGLRESNQRLSRRPVWRACAPAGAADPAVWIDDSPAWRAWALHLRKRRPPGDAGRVDSSPLLWAIPGEPLDDDGRALLGRLHDLNDDAEPGQLAAAALKAWLAERDAGGTEPATPEFALTCLAWARALPALAQHAPAEAWWDLLAVLTSSADDAAGIDPDARPLLHQWLAGELPLTLAWACREISSCWELRQRARSALGRGLSELLDRDGLPHCRHLNEFRPLLACWTRCRLLGSDFKRGCWDANGEKQYRRALHSSIRLSRADGSQLLSGEGAAGGWSEGLFSTALRLFGKSEEAALARIALPFSKQERACIAARESSKKPTRAGQNSEDSCLTVLRTDWRRTASKLAIAYAGSELRAELEVGGETLLAGDWSPHVERDGVPLAPQGAWRSLCWVSDRDADYFEAEIQIAGGVRVQRQVLLAREDELLFVADAVLGESPGELAYRLDTPLAAGVEFRAADETREGTLAGRKPRAVVMPLALPEWRSDRRGGSLEAAECGLRLEQRAHGTSLFAPLFVDLCPRRLTKPRTWRRLTVGRDMTAVPADEAVAFRVQVGKRQWTVYRSLAPVAGRSYLGQHTFYDFVIGRFTRKGELEPLLEIE
jgi:hypothetical protein